MMRKHVGAQTARLDILCDTSASYSRLIRVDMDFVAMLGTGLFLGGGASTNLGELSYSFVFLLI